jgi:hypothetical protein
MKTQNCSPQILTVLLLPLLFLFSSFRTVTKPNEHAWICENLKHTYQIILHERGQVQLPNTICDQLQSARKQSERVTIVYSPYVSIVVFSYDEIANLNTNSLEIVYDVQ